MATVYALRCPDYNNGGLVPACLVLTPMSRYSVHRGEPVESENGRGLIAQPSSFARRQAAESFWDGLRAGVAQIEPVGTADIETAYEIGRGFPDQDFSIVDRTSFAVMERLGIERAASFDDDFAVFRYGRYRERALTVIR